ncbi:hypothetical protein [Leptodesmis sp.]|uniref:hypothetical protein n=1 Tax=Leptodesmis sp. TaxID=3100501 RepID=UPI0040535199
MLFLAAMPEKSGDNLAWLTKHRNNLLLSFNLIPFAGIAFLWFMGVVRDYLGDNEDQFFATIFLGSGLVHLGTKSHEAATVRSR